MNENPKRNPDVVTNILPDGHIVLVSEKTNWAYTLTPLAALVWEFCDGDSNLDQIVANILAIEEIPKRDNLKHEVITLVEELQESGFLVAD